MDDVRAFPQLALPSGAGDASVMHGQWNRAGTRRCLPWVLIAGVVLTAAGCGTQQGDPSSIASIPTGRVTYVDANAYLQQVPASEGQDLRKPGKVYVASLAPDGSGRLALVQQGTADPLVLSLFDPSTGRSERLAQDLVPSTADWAPDGQQLALTSYGDSFFEVYRVAVSDGSTVRVGERGEWSPSWSPDGTQIALARERTNSLGYEVVIMNSDGSDPRVIAGADGFPFPPDSGSATVAWDPEGGWIAYVDAGEQPQIHLVHTDGTEDHVLVQGEEPAWSPDGKWVAFSRTKTGAMSTSPTSGGDVVMSAPERTDIWIVSVSGGQPEHVAEGSSPSWGPR